MNIIKRNFFAVRVLVLSAILVGAGLVFLPQPAHAAVSDDPNCAALNQQLAALDPGGPAPWSNLVGSCTANNLLLRIIRIGFLVAGSVALLFVIIGGFQYMVGMSAGGDEAIAKAKKTITYALLGLVIILLSGAIITVMVNLIVGNSGNSGSLVNPGTGKTQNPTTGVPNPTGTIFTQGQSGYSVTKNSPAGKTTITITASNADANKACTPPSVYADVSYTYSLGLTPGTAQASVNLSSSSTNSAYTGSAALQTANASITSVDLCGNLAIPSN